MPISQTFDRAFAHHQAGQLGEAERLYREVLAQVTSAGGKCHGPPLCAARHGTCHLHLSLAVIAAELLLQAYAQAAFPMGMPGGEIGWFSPDPRAIIPLNDFHVPHGLRRTLKKGRFEIRIDTSFETVMRKCAARDETWINEEIVASYVNLHRRGFAHSVEAWCDGELAGGLYGVAIGGAFFGESMFHEVTDASKVALHALVMRLRERGYALLDTQWTTPHLEQFGTREIPLTLYKRLLSRALREERQFGD